MKKTFLLPLLMPLMLTACGGGSLESDTPDTEPTVLVNAGANQSVNEQTTVTLTAEAVGQTSTLTYSWRISPALTLTQTDATSPQVSFTTPETTRELEYTLLLTVTDSVGNQGTDSVIIRVLPVNEAPVANIALTQPADAVQSAIPAGIEVVLDGSGSIDIDATDSDRPIAAWRWQQTAGSDALSNVSLEGESLAFITPIEDEDSSITLELTVTDEEGATDVATIELGILSASNTLPTVSAGVDHEVFSGELIILSGQASTSIPNAEPLRFYWLNDSDITPQINNDRRQETYAIAPVVSETQTATFTLEVRDAFANIVNDSITVTIRPFPLQPVNDTGVFQQASADFVGVQYQPDYPGQDGQRGQDRIADSGLLEKAGRGQQGFDFTRLDMIGDEVDDTNLPWRCVRDNVTGLIWEVKTADTTLHGAEHTYSWFQEENEGGDPGDENGLNGSCHASLPFCNTQAYVRAINNEGLCNFYDWRLPTHEELLSIVHFGKTGPRVIDTDYFPYTVFRGNAPVWYWTSLSSVDGAEEDARNAWTIDFASGNDNFLNKSAAARVRLVRGGR